MGGMVLGKSWGLVLSQCRYTWSDLCYDYAQTVGFGGSISRPVRRENPIAC